MEWSIIALIVVSAVLVLVLIAWLITSLVKRRKHDGEVTGKVYVRKDVRYTKSEEVTDKNGNAKISFNEGDILLDRDQTYLVAKESKLLPGKYTVLVADDNMPNVKIRLGGIVRTFEHNSEIVLAEGDKICAISGTVVLR